jgi:hypothetical protein
MTFQVGDRVRSGNLTGTVLKVLNSPAGAVKQVVNVKWDADRVDRYAPWTKEEWWEWSEQLEKE